MQRIHAAKSDFKSEDIVQQSTTVFSVKSKGASENPGGTTTMFNWKMISFP